MSSMTGPQTLSPQDRLNTHLLHHASYSGTGMEHGGFTYHSTLLTFGCVLPSPFPQYRWPRHRRRSPNRRRPCRRPCRPCLCQAAAPRPVSSGLSTNALCHKRSGRCMHHACTTQDVPDLCRAQAPFWEWVGPPRGPTCDHTKCQAWCMRQAARNLAPYRHNGRR